MKADTGADGKFDGERPKLAGESGGGSSSTALVKMNEHNPLIARIVAALANERELPGLRARVAEAYGEVANVSMQKLIPAIQSTRIALMCTGATLITILSQADRPESLLHGAAILLAKLGIDMTVAALIAGASTASLAIPAGRILRWSDKKKLTRELKTASGKLLLAAVSSIVDDETKAAGDPTGFVDVDTHEAGQMGQLTEFAHALSSDTALRRRFDDFCTLGNIDPSTPEDAVKAVALFRAERM